MNTSSIDFVLLIPCYNNKKGLVTSLKSIQYPKEKCEVVIVDDGSMPALSLEELQTEAPLLSVKVIRIAKNQGIVNALNTGLGWISNNSNAIYIARLDAGDCCHPDRFYKQVAFLNKHPEIALLGTWARFQNEITGDGYNYITKTIHDEILKEMHYKCSFIHPSVMFRKRVLETIGFYPVNYPHAEDYAYFWKILKKYNGAVLPEKLVQINYSKTNISARNYKRQLQSRKKIVKKFGDIIIDRSKGIILINIRLMLPQAFINTLKRYYLRKK